MSNLLTILGIIAGCAFTAFTYFIYIHNDNLAIKSLLAGFIVSVLACLLWLIHVVHGWFSKRFVRRSDVADHSLSRQPISTGGEKFRFGVYWDSDLNPLCPACKTPLTLSRRGLAYVISDDVPLPTPILHCFKCDKSIRLYDDEANELTLSEAKRLLSLENPNNPKLLQAIERLQTISDHLPAGDVKEKYVDIYHQALREIEHDIGRRLIQHAIPPDELKYIETHHPRAPRIGNFPGSPAHTTRSKDRYCDRAVFLIALNSAIASLRQ